FGFRQLNLKRIQAHVLPHNPASSRILDKVGFTREGRLRSFMFRRRRWHDLYIYSILREDWRG
ncbi:MAG: GNAT family N-acetyltransferase, partial [Candidatus Zixiibacteriota bacterium]